jgi:hypothetical protein
VNIQWTGQAMIGEDVSFRVGRAGEYLVAEWPNVATLRCTRDGGAIAFEVYPTVASALAHKLQHGPVRALLRHLRGELSLHAGAAAYKGVALAFLGDPSAGKSTTVGHLCARGWAAVTDDILPIDRDFRAVPCDPFLWLEPDARRFLEHDDLLPTEVIGVAHPPPIVALVVLRFGMEEPSLRRLHGAQAIAALTAAHVRFVLDEPPIHARDMERVFAVLEHVPVFELVRPRDLNRMDRSAVLLESLVDALKRSRGSALEEEAP